ncbi:YggT family protein [Hydrogenovibrio marinus]|uniref:YggT family protein n=1 Tax=Hydrogenovibrio marinus TaxID=28885 RepID=A0A066ZPI4_HYDMR|nr:YggT family protein [Hydrogenovibrio marinus]KDN95693.1 hypothetical protein EI16_05185 [Hydrogenovibrio marinus]BBN58827.1 membrane protein [Hydrogenovibrio marinus]
MSPIGQGGLFLIQFIAGLIVFSLILRFLLRAAYVDWRHPIVTFIAKVTNPLCVPFNKILTLRGRWDWSALLTALVIEGVSAYLIGWLGGRDYSFLLIVIYSVTELLNQILDMMFWIIIIQAVLSWVVQGYNPNVAIFYQLAEPILRPFQRVVPPIGGLDLSPLVAILVIKLIQIVVVGSIAQIGQGLVA